MTILGGRRQQRQQSSCLIYYSLIVLLVATSVSANLSYKLIEELLFFDDFDLQDQLTCFTCSASESNDDCNHKAIDEPCASMTSTHSVSHGDEHSVNQTITMSHDTVTKYACMTIHRFDASSLRTVSIEKKCSTVCGPDQVGCVDEPGPNNSTTRVCTYCCGKSYCNLDSLTTTREALKLADNFWLNHSTKPTSLSVRTTYFLALLLSLCSRLLPVSVV